jgi:hypothetical protein
MTDCKVLPEPDGVAPILWTAHPLTEAQQFERGISFRTMLLGVVDNAVDHRIAEVRAREMTGVFQVDNGLTVAQK